MLTCIALSAYPFEFKDLPRHISYLNHVSYFKTVAEHAAARRAALAKVKTSHCFFQDIDDPLPNLYPDNFKGVYHGDFIAHLVKDNRDMKIPAKPHTKQVRYNTPLIVHKAIIETAPAQAIAKTMPEGNYSFEAYLYYFLYFYYGYTYDPKLEMLWNKGEFGFHKYDQGSAGRTMEWIKKNELSVLDQLPGVQRAT